MDTERRTHRLDDRLAAGLRRLTPQMLATMEAADSYRHEARMKPGQVLAAFKAAAPFLGIRPNIVHAVDWLFRFTNPLDWEPFSRPIVWPSASLQGEGLGVGLSQVKNLNRVLVELGLVVMKDSANGKRFGRRGTDGRIIEAYGFDLSPLASRVKEFEAVAQAGLEARAHYIALRRRATIARNAIRQLVETACEYAVSAAEWEALKSAAGARSQGIAQKHPHELEEAVDCLEKLQDEMRHVLNRLLRPICAASGAAVDAFVECDPKGPGKWPHIIATKEVLNPRDTVEPDRTNTPGGTLPGCTTLSDGSLPIDAGIVTAELPLSKASPENYYRAFCLSPREMAKLAPRLTCYLKTNVPTWPDLVEAADWLRNEMGVSRMIWGEACLVMGREQAALAVAIVSSKPTSHYRSSASAYFRGMVAKAKMGELNLERSIWGMRARVG
jgi:replication initiation protein RepC